MKYIGGRLLLPHVHESQGRNEDYPELSFTMFSHAVEGLAGFSADLPAGRIVTCPCLPEEVPGLSIRGLRLGIIAWILSFFPITRRRSTTIQTVRCAGNARLQGNLPATCSFCS